MFEKKITLSFESLQIDWCNYCLALLFYCFLITYYFIIL